MFGQLRTLKGSQILKGGLVACAVLMLAPGAVVVLLAAALMLVPVALVGIPFMLPAFFGTASAEHDAELKRRSLPPHGGIDGRQAALATDAGPQLRALS